MMQKSLLAVLALSLRKSHERNLRAISSATAMKCPRLPLDGKLSAPLALLSRTPREAECLSRRRRILRTPH